MPKIVGGSWVQVDGKLVPRNEVARVHDDAPYVQGDIEEFKSPINGQVITSRSHLRKHMNEHGVTDSRDYSNDWYEKKGKARDAVLRAESSECKQGRIEAIKEAIRIHS